MAVQGPRVKAVFATAQPARVAHTRAGALGVAHYRAGNWDQAVEALAKSDEHYGGNKFSINGFFLAMAHWQKGNREEAQALYQKSVAWMDEHKPEDAELKGFRNEATELMDYSDPTGSATTEDKENEQTEDNVMPRS